MAWPLSKPVSFARGGWLRENTLCRPPSCTRQILVLLLPGRYGIGGTCLSAGTAIRAQIGIDDILVITFADRLDRALIRAGPAGDAFFRNPVRHLEYSLSVFLLPYAGTMPRTRRDTGMPDVFADRPFTGNTLDTVIILIYRIISIIRRSSSCPRRSSAMSVFHDSGIMVFRSDTRNIDMLRYQK